MPETIVVVTALVVLFLDLNGMRSTSRSVRRVAAATATCAGCLFAILWMILWPLHGTVGAGMLVSDSLTDLMREALLVLTILTTLVSLDSDFTEHVGEYFAVILMASAGMMFLAGTENVLMLFVSIELTSLS